MEDIRSAGDYQFAHDVFGKLQFQDMGFGHIRTYFYPPGHIAQVHDLQPNFRLPKFGSEPKYKPTVKVGFNPDLELTFLRDDRFTTGWASIAFTRNTLGLVNGMKLTTGRTRNLKFRKQ